LKVKIDDIKFIQSLYPRDSLHNDIVNSYCLNLDALPPITITKNMTLVDGYHRLVAYKVSGKSEIECESPLDITEEKDILIEAIKRNSTHGLQLNMTEKRNLARRLYESDWVGTQEELTGILGVSQQSISNWVGDIKQTKDEERDERIIQLYLVGKTEQEIADEFKLTQPRVQQIINNTINSKIYIPDSLQFYDVWSFSYCDKRYGLAGFEGRIPGQILENLLYYYTEPLDLVVDPMVGSGMTIDVCKSMYRRYQGYDIESVGRADIQQHDITQGYLPKAKNCDLVFIDPPYWSMLKGRFGEESVSSLSLNDYYLFVAKLAKDTFSVLKQDGIFAFLIQNQTEKDLEGGYPIIHTYKTAKLIESAGFRLIREINCPQSTQTFLPQQIEIAKEERRMLGIVRDLLIWKKI